MELTEIVEKLTGPILATGSHSEDERRLASLEQTITLADDLVTKLRQASVASSRHEASMKKIGQRADDALRIIASDLEQFRD